MIPIPNPKMNAKHVRSWMRMSSKSKEAPKLSEMNQIEAIAELKIISSKIEVIIELS